MKEKASNSVKEIIIYIGLGPLVEDYLAEIVSPCSLMEQLKVVWNMIK